MSKLCGFIFVILTSVFAGAAWGAGDIRDLVPAAFDNVACGREGARCTTGLDCCNSSCRSGTCNSGIGECKGNGSSCSNSSACCSRYCIGSRCQPHP